MCPQFNTPSTYQATDTRKCVSCRKYLPLSSFKDWRKTCNACLEKVKSYQVRIGIKRRNQTEIPKSKPEPEPKPEHNPCFWVLVSCKHCQGEFWAKRCQLKRGECQYCSQKCRWAYYRARQPKGIERSAKSPCEKQLPKHSPKRCEPPEGYIKCPHCRAYRAPSMFVEGRKQCDFCAKRNKRYHLRNQEYHKAKMVARQYGITVDEYRSLQRQANGRCAICGESQAHVFRGGSSPLEIDHDHVTGRIRGIICHRCNIAVAAIEGVNPTLIDKIRDYLRK